jgi:hypothetical protein
MQALAVLATILGVTPHGNQVAVRLDHGSAELVWVTPSAFRFRRVLEGALPEVDRPADEPVQFEVDDTTGSVRLRSKFIEVTLQKRGALVRVRRLDGTVLMTDLSEPQESGSGVAWDRQMFPEARYYGLGPRTDAAFDLRGKSAQPESPFLFSTLGHAEYHAGPGAYRFDFTASGRYRIQAPAMDYYFYYGPTLKQAMEEHKRVRGSSALWAAATERFGTWATLRSALLRIVHGAISGMLSPTLDLGAYASAPPELQRRARQLGSLIAEVSPGKLGMSDFRNQLASFFEVYETEAADKGYPIWHPLPFQFPEDPECALHVDEFMLGDELLVAPVVAPGNTRSLYLPQGIWTNLDTNEVFTGRRTISITTEALPVFARNGTIVPLDSASGIELHYFPKLGAEFFLVEDEGWTQVHAAPAADVMRLEIESKKGREYVWVVHHVTRPLSVGFDGRALPWTYEGENLRIPVKVAAGADSIVNVAFE